jgi:hypothetical protein
MTGYFAIQYIRLNQMVQQISSLPTPSVSPTASPSPTPEPESDNSNKQIGYIKTVKQAGDHYELTIDYIQFLSGEPARQAAKADNQCEDETCEIPNDYYIRNQNTKLRTFSINNRASVIMETFSQADNNYNFDQKISLDTFASIFKTGSKSQQMESPYWIDLDTNNQVIAIKEQYLP